MTHRAGKRTRLTPCKAPDGVAMPVALAGARGLKEWTDRRAYNAKYRAEHPEKMRALRTAWDAANRDRKYAATKAWWSRHPEYKREWKAAHPDEWAKYAAAHPEQIVARGREYRATHREEEAERHRRYAQEHPERRSYNEATRRARKRSAGGVGISYGQWVEMMDEYGRRCAYCAETRALEMDHLAPLSRGGVHDVTNVAPACKSCNASKSNHSLIVWLARRAIGGYANRSRR